MNQPDTDRPDALRMALDSTPLMPRDAGHLFPPTSAQSPMAAPAAPAAAHQANPRAIAVAELMSALAGFDALPSAGTSDPVTAIAAQQLLDELRLLCAQAPQTQEALQRAAWSRVVEARSAYKRLLDGNAPATAATISAVDLARIETEHRDLEDAERKARKALSGPSAFKKFAAARRQLTASLEALGVTTIDELRQLVTAGPTAVGPRTLSEASEAVALAEQDWNRLEHQGSGTIPQTPEADAFRARAYRLIGRVIHDDVIEAELRALADGGQAVERAKSRVATALMMLNVPAGDDPISAARAVAAVIAV